MKLDCGRLKVAKPQQKRVLNVEFSLIKSILTNQPLTPHPNLQLGEGRGSLRRKKFAEIRAKGLDLAFEKLDQESVQPKHWREVEGKKTAPKLWCNANLLTGIRSEFKKLDIVSKMQIAMAPTPMAGGDYSWIAPFIVPNTARHVDEDESHNGERLPKTHENTYLHCLLEGPNVRVLDQKTGKKSWKSVIKHIVKGKIKTPEPLVISQKVEQKIMHKEGGARPTYSATYRQPHRAIHLKR